MYAELACTTNFSFLRGASHPEELVAQAIAIGLSGLGIADRNSVAGVVRAHVFLRENKEQAKHFRVVSGARLVFCDGTPDLIVYPQDRAAWARLTQLLTRGNLRAQKGKCLLMLEDLCDFQEGLQIIVLARSSFDESEDEPQEQREVEFEASPLPPPQVVELHPARPPLPAEGGERIEVRGSLGSSVLKDLCQGPSPCPSPAERERGRSAITQPKLLPTLSRLARGRVWIGAQISYGPNARRALAERTTLARMHDLPLIALNDVIMHSPERRPLADVVTCIRRGLTMETGGRHLHANAERHLKPPREMARLFEEVPLAIEETMRFLAGIRFSLDDLRYEYPDELREGFANEQEALEAFTQEGAQRRYPMGVPSHVQQMLRHELDLVRDLGYAAYFLTVHDIVRFARSRKILCQGRGSAANSTVCFCLGITEVDPTKHDLLFERFISAERSEPPDIDVDFEHERREEVMQYIYKRYGRHRAGLTATVISYRSRSSTREVAKVFGYSEAETTALVGTIAGWWSGEVNRDELRKIGFDPQDHRLALALDLSRELAGFPRHLSQHTGGFVITRDRLDAVMPIAHASMEERTTIEWDKDDLDALGILKIDILALGMLSALRRGFDLLRDHYQQSLTLSTITQEDPAVYRMIQRADTIGVFQIESRAQMSMLPRLKPREFYDLVIEVAIVRPGPIQGDMVHPYLRRRQGLEPVNFPKQELANVLGKTLGVPLFQEQAMKIAIVAAGFTPGEADKLRRAMATFKRVGTIHTFHAKMVDGMVARGYERDFADRCFKQIEGFGTYGFPESHAASFALLVYASAWMKCRYPDVFACALINSQPMGFYAPSQIVRDARDHGVSVREVDVNASHWDCTLEEESPATLCVAAPHPNPLPASGARGQIELDDAERPLSRVRERDRVRAPAPRALSVHPRHSDQANDIHTTHALRLGFRQIQGVREDDMTRIASLRGKGYDSVRDVWLRTRLSPAVLERLAAADAFRSIGLDRRDALWAVRGLNRAGDKDDLPLFARVAHGESEPDVHLPPMPPGEQVVEDYRHLSLSLKAHPVSFLRPQLTKKRVLRSEELERIVAPKVRVEPGARQSHFPWVSVAGLVLVRQRPGSAHGVIFMTLEDETGVTNIIVWPKVFERERAKVLGGRFVCITGRLQNEAGVIHVVAERVEDLTPMLSELSDDGRRISALANADELKRPQDREKSEDKTRRLALTEEAAVMPKGRNFR